MSNANRIMSRVTFDQLERVAAETLSSVKVSGPVDAFLLADALGLMLTPVGQYEEAFDGHEIRFNAKASHRTQQEFVARCVAQHALKNAGFYATEHAVDRLSRALMLPRRRFAADV